MYDFDVARVTISIDAKTLKEIQRRAGKRGVSRFFVEAAKKEIGEETLDDFLRDMERKWGKPDPKLHAAIGRDLKRIFKIK